MRFIDSNVLIYAVDDTDADKQRVARSVVYQAISSADFIISTQVINEFCAVSFRKLMKPVDEIDGFLSVLEGITTVPVLQSWTRRALWIMNRYNLQFFDSLLLAAAEANGCDEILTEDLNDGQVYCGIKAVNPFQK
ncbi:MAG: PIN domain-containing protein [Kiritimatiellae bacterium]|nr:PIN domain-containing protein [Kiritimatiellia bacterium]MBP5227170.1 PIN domain-containing protein [Kiritimatiellia bacterium]